VFMQVEARLEADQIKLLARSIAPIDIAVADAGSAGLRVFIADDSAIVAVRNVLHGAQRDGVKGGRGPIYICLLDPHLPGEVELELGQDFPVSPQIKGALRSLGGVMDVQEA